MSGIFDPAIFDGAIFDIGTVIRVGPSAATSNGPFHGPDTPFAAWNRRRRLAEEDDEAAMLLFTH